MITQQDITPIIEIGETPNGYITFRIVNNADMSLTKVVGILNVIVGGMISKVPDSDKIKVEDAIYDSFNKTRGMKVNVTPPL
jgi:hypothetical protein